MTVHLSNLWLFSYFKVDTQSSDDYSEMKIKVEVQIDDHEESFLEGIIDKPEDEINKVPFTDSHVFYEHDYFKGSNENITSSECGISESGLNETLAILNGESDTKDYLHVSGNDVDTNSDTPMEHASEPVLNVRKKPPGRSYVCSDCRMKFTCKAKLDQHKIVHFRENIKCSACDKVFMTKSTLKRHMKTHEDRNIEED